MSERQSHWQQVYRRKSPLEVSWYQSEPQTSLALIERCQLGADAPIIDVGGGASLLVDCLLERGYQQLTVLDIASAALQHSRSRLGARGEQVSWIADDVTGFQAANSYVLWHDRAVFHFLTEAADRRRYLDRLKAALQPGGFLILSSFAIGGPEKCSGLEVVQYDADKLQGELGDDFRLLDQQPETHLTPLGRQQAFHYFRFAFQPQ